jgi:hypothetical protein
MSLIWHSFTWCSIRGKERTFRHCVQTGSGVHQLPIRQVPGVISLGVKLPECDAVHSPPSGTNVE